MPSDDQRLKNEQTRVRISAPVLSEHLWNLELQFSESALISTKWVLPAELGGKIKTLK